MDHAGSIRFTDGNSGDEARVDVRTNAGRFALAVSSKSGGAAEVFMSEGDATRLVTLLERAIGLDSGPRTLEPSRMEHTVAEAIIEGIEAVGDRWNKLTEIVELIENEEERKRFLRLIAEPMMDLNIYAMLPIIRQYPDLDPDK